MSATICACCYPPMHGMCGLCELCRAAGCAAGPGCPCRLNRAGGLDHKFKPGDRVVVDPRCGYPATIGVVAVVDKLAPYTRTNTPGYYVTWDYAAAGIKPEQWLTAGGWKDEASLTAEGGAL